MDSTSEPGENDESDDDDEVGEFEKYVWVPGELKSGLGYPEQRSALDYQDTAWVQCKWQITYLFSLAME